MTGNRQRLRITWRESGYGQWERSRTPSPAEPRSLPPCSYEEWYAPFWILRPARYHAKGQDETLLVKRNS